MSQTFGTTNRDSSQSFGLQGRHKRGAETLSKDSRIGQVRVYPILPPILYKLTFTKGMLLPLLVEFPLAAIFLKWIFSGVTAIQTSHETLWARPFGISILLGLMIFCFAITSDGLFRVFKRIQTEAIFGISADGVKSFRFWKRRTWKWNEIEKVEVTRSNALFTSPQVSFIRKGFLSSKATMPSITKKQREKVKQAILAFAPHLPIHEQTPFWGSSLLDQKTDAPTVNPSAPVKTFNAAKIEIDPIEFHIAKSNAIYGGGAVLIGSLLMWYAAFYLAWPDYRPTAHWFELGKKFAIAQNFLIQAFAYSPLVRTVPVIVGAVLLIIDGFWRISIFNAKQPILKIDSLGVSAFKFWSPIKLPWTEIEEVMKSELHHGMTTLAIFGKHEFGKPTSVFPFFQIVRPQINFYHLSDEQMQTVESLIVQNIPHIKRTLRTQDKIVQITSVNSH